MLFSACLNGLVLFDILPRGICSRIHDKFGIVGQLQPFPYLDQGLLECNLLGDVVADVDCDFL